MSLPRTALVTGSARRIGHAIARALAEDGFALALHAHTSIDDAEALAAEIRSRGGRAVALTGDLADAAAAERLVPAAAAALGPVGLLVNNASVFEDDRLPDVTGAALEHHFAVNTAAPILLAQALARGLPDGADGLVVNLLDQRVEKTTPHCFAYTVSKLALAGATRTLAQGLAPRVRVVGISPGPTLPNLREGEEGFAREIAATPLGRGPALAEFAAAVRFFLAARSVTGEVVALDGGQRLAWQTPDVIG
jgi:NAD(P)-dependent dehydrogenase (short-subunit alcohol dehydrogenase family)